MKKLLILATCVLSFGAVLCSCSSPDNGDVQVQTRPPQTQNTPINTTPDNPAQPEVSGFASAEEVTTWKNENKGKTFKVTLISNDQRGIKLGHSSNVPSTVARKHWKVEVMQNGKVVEALLQNGKPVLKAFSEKDDRLFDLDKSKLAPGSFDLKVTTKWTISYEGKSEDWEDSITMTVDN